MLPLFLLSNLSLHSIWGFYFVRRDKLGNMLFWHLDQSTRYIRNWKAASFWRVSQFISSDFPSSRLIFYFFSFWVLLLISCLYLHLIRDWNAAAVVTSTSQSIICCFDWDNFIPAVDFLVLISDMIQPYYSDSSVSKECYQFVCCCCILFFNFLLQCRCLFFHAWREIESIGSVLIRRMQLLLGANAFLHQFRRSISG